MIQLIIGLLFISISASHAASLQHLLLSTRTLVAILGLVARALRGRALLTDLKRGERDFRTPRASAIAPSREPWLWSSTATELLVMKRHKRGPVLRDRSTNTDPRSTHVTRHGRDLEPTGSRRIAAQLSRNEAVQVR